MNKKEFYRNLMLTYTVDTDKVKRIAKRRVVKRSSRILRIIPGAAACAAVTAAAVTIVSLGTARNGGVDIVDNEEAYARMEAAEQYYITLPNDDELIMDMYVSFEHGLSYNEVLLSFSKIDENGDIKIHLLYTENGNYYENSESVSNDESLIFLGAKITAPASLCRDIRLLNTVSLVELPQSGITDDSFLPFGSSEFVTSTGTANDAFEISIPSYTTAEDDTTEASDTADTTDSPDGADTEDNSDVTTADTADTTPDEIPADIRIPVAGVTAVRIISADHIVVTTDDSIRLYRLKEGVLGLETTFYASNAKISWSSYDGSDLFITACESGARTRLYWADGKAGALTELDVSAITEQGAEISSIVRTPDGSMTLLRTVSNNKSRVYTVRRLESSLSINLVLEYDSPVTSLALIGDRLYFAITDTKNSTVTIAAKSLSDGAVTEIASYSGTLHFTRSQTFNSAALTFTSADGEEICVLLTPEGALMETELRDIIFSRTDGRIFTDGEYYYIIGSDGTVTQDPEANAAAAFAPAPAPGNYTCVIQEDGSAYLMLKEQ